MLFPIAKISDLHPSKETFPVSSPGCTAVCPLRNNCRLPQCSRKYMFWFDPCNCLCPRCTKISSVSLPYKPVCKELCIRRKCMMPFCKNNEKIWSDPCGCACPTCVKDNTVYAKTCTVVCDRHPRNCHLRTCEKGKSLWIDPCNCMCPECIPNRIEQVTHHIQKRSSQQCARYCPFSELENCSWTCEKGYTLERDPCNCKCPRCVRDYPRNVRNEICPNCQPKNCTPITCQSGYRLISDPCGCECDSCVKIFQTALGTICPVMCTQDHCKKNMLKSCPKDYVLKIDPCYCDCPKCVREQIQLAPNCPVCDKPSCESLYCFPGFEMQNDPCGCKCPICVKKVIHHAHLEEKYANKKHCQIICTQKRCHTERFNCPKGYRLLIDPCQCLCPECIKEEEAPLMNFPDKLPNSSHEHKNTFTVYKTDRRMLEAEPNRKTSELNIPKNTITHNKHLNELVKIKTIKKLVERLRDLHAETKNLKNEISKQRKIIKSHTVKHYPRKDNGINEEENDEGEEKKRKRSRNLLRSSVNGQHSHAHNRRGRNKPQQLEYEENDEEEDRKNRKYPSSNLRKVRPRNRSLKNKLQKIVSSRERTNLKYRKPKRTFQNKSEHRHIYSEKEEEDDDKEFEEKNTGVPKRFKSYIQKNKRKMLSNTENTENVEKHRRYNNQVRRWRKHKPRSSRKRYLESSHDDSDIYSENSGGPTVSRRVRNLDSTKLIGNVTCYGNQLTNKTEFEFFILLPPKCQSLNNENKILTSTSSEIYATDKNKKEIVKKKWNKHSVKQNTDSGVILEYLA